MSSLFCARFSFQFVNIQKTITLQQLVREPDTKEIDYG